MPEEYMRGVTAELAAHQYLIGFLLKNAFRELDADQIAEVAKVLKDQAKKVPDSISGAFPGNDFLSERLADLIVRMHTEIDKIVNEAAAAVIQVASK
jgi:hypothetical protein